MPGRTKVVKDGSVGFRAEMTVVRVLAVTY